MKTLRIILSSIIGLNSFSLFLEGFSSFPVVLSSGGITFLTGMLMFSPSGNKNLSLKTLSLGLNLILSLRKAPNR